MILTGSNFSNYVGALFFEKEGGISLHYAPEIDKTSEESLLMAATFFEYALSRQDWMLEFLEDEILPNESSHKDNKDIVTPNLQVIQGGLSSGSL